MDQPAVNWINNKARGKGWNWTVVAENGSSSCGLQELVSLACVQHHIAVDKTWSGLKQHSHCGTSAVTLASSRLDVL